jgi:GT2 family glycosyltransferase
LISDSPDLDIVIPTRDRPRQLSKCLDALAQQRAERFGVIVVDDGGATPASHLVPDDVRDRLRMRFVRNETSIGPGASRNRGVQVSNATHLVFLDDDCVASPELIGRHKAALAASDHVVSLGPILSPPGQRKPAWTHWDADRMKRNYDSVANGQRSPDWTLLYTGNVGLQRADFVAIGGFDLRFSRQEDIELGYRLTRLGCRIQFDPEAVVWHDSERSLRTWTRIPAASASFDVLMDRLDPESLRLSTVREDLGTRHWALRVARHFASVPAAQRGAVAAAIGAGLLLHAVRADRPALSAFSLVWDLTYIRALRDATAEPSQ